MTLLVVRSSRATAASGSDVISPEDSNLSALHELQQHLGMHTVITCIYLCRLIKVYLVNTAVQWIREF